MALTYFKKSYPRKYAAPGGWGSPKHAALSLAAHTASAVRRQGNAEATVLREGWASLLLCQLVANDVPTYWVGSDLAEALWYTKFPSEFRLESVKLPHTGMLFMLPRSLPFNTTREHVWAEWLGFAATMSSDGGDNGRPGFICPLGNHFGGISGGAGYMDETMSEWASAVKSEIQKQDTNTNNAVSETEKRSAELHSIIKFTANLLLYMADRGVDALVDDSTTAPTGTGKLHTAHEPNKTGLWQPKWIGKNYRKKTEWQGGTHASPRLHRRDGHWRQQPYGPGRQEIKRIWIDTMWVNAA